MFAPFIRPATIWHLPWSVSKIFWQNGHTWSLPAQNTVFATFIYTFTKRSSHFSGSSGVKFECKVITNPELINALRIIIGISFWNPLFFAFPFGEIDSIKVRVVLLKVPHPAASIKVQISRELKFLSSRRFHMHLTRCNNGRWSVNSRCQQYPLRKLFRLLTLNYLELPVYFFLKALDRTKINCKKNQRQ